MLEYFINKPITRTEQDEFLRDKFSERIASLISTPKIDKSFVLGIYGKWGDGKTSVINLIKQHIHSETVIVNFNPWYFSDQQQLLHAFFKEFVRSLGKNNSDLKKRLGTFFEKYSNSLGGLTQLTTMLLSGQVVAQVDPNAMSNIYKEIGKELQSNSVEESKKNIDELLIKEGKNIVVFIDDIDRLDAQEMYFMLKLVKLIGDFPRTSYVLAFDEKVVANSVGQFFGNNPEAGSKFLEKIVQLNINLPKATNKQLLQFLNKKLKSVVDQYSINIEVSMLDTFQKKFGEVFNPIITSPRLAVQYCNNVSMLLPLMKEEVNLTDLLLLEATKVFLPDVYALIKNEGSRIIAFDSPFHKVAIDFHGVDKNQTKQLIIEEINKHPPILQEKVQSLLIFFFPQVEDILRNHGSTDEMRKKWILEKRICSIYHFDKFFTYSVQEDEIPDALLDNLRSLLGTEKIGDDTLNKFFEQNFRNVNLDELINRFRYWETLLNEQESIKLAKVVVYISKTLQGDNSDFLKVSTSANAAILVANLLSNISDVTTSFEISRELLTETESINFSIDLEESLRYAKNPYNGNLTFSEDHDNDFKEIIIKKCLLPKYIGELFSLPEYQLVKLFNWLSRTDKGYLIKGHLTKMVNNNFDNALWLIKLFVPSARNGSGKTFKCNFIKPYYETLEKICDTDELYKVVKVNRQSDRFNPDLYFDRFYELKNHEIVDLFINYYLEGKSNSQTLESPIS